MTTPIIAPVVAGLPVSASGVVLPAPPIGPLAGFVRYKGDDWDGANILLFQYGTLAGGVLTPFDITGFQPVGRILLQQIAAPMGQTGVTYPAFTLSVIAGTARIIDGPNGIFGLCPRADITSQLPIVADPVIGTAADFTTAIVQVAAKLIDVASPGNLGTFCKVPVLVLQA